MSHLTIDDPFTLQTFAEVALATPDEGSLAVANDVALEDKPGFERRIERVPLGVVFNMPAWNYPLLTCVNALVPAVMAGNAVLLKHSSRTALCGLHFADALASAGAPDGLVTAIHCDHQRLGTACTAGRTGVSAGTGNPGGAPWGRDPLRRALHFSRRAGALL